jgi:signal transduction histidine kinase/CheY-like chemotaxis protein
MNNKANSTNQRILVIDDEPGITRLCSRILEKSGFDVLPFTDPKGGLTALENNPIDSLLVDIRMPEMDGFQVIDHARQLQPDLAVVVMTGFGTVETAIEALRRGADGLILKPFTGEELIQSVKRSFKDSQRKQDVLRLQALRPLFDVTETLFTETNPDRLLNIIMQAVCGHLNCTHAELYHRIEANTGTELVILASNHSKEDISPNIGNHSTSIIHSEPIVSWVEVNNSPILVNYGGSGDPKIQSLLVDTQLGSVMCVPITLKSETSNDGVLLAARERNEPTFRESDLEMFVILTRQASIAFENARLHDELRDYIRQVEESQRALVQAEKMAIAGRLTASIAHEINNPLQAVQNCLHLAMRDELSDIDRQSYMNMAENELERLMNTVQRMLYFYRPVGLDRKPIELNSIIERVLTLLEKQLSDHKISTHLSLESQLPLVMAVGDQIQQVFLNLILNAIEAMPDGGELFISSKTLHIIDENEVEFLIEDTGPGVTTDDRMHIFEPFISTKEEGTGLGLAVSYGIISAHGGNIELLDKQRRGACFRITLPVTVTHG